MALLAKEKEILVPGEEIAKGIDYIPGNGTYRDKDTIVCQRFGLLSISGRTVYIIPLTGKYVPKKNDTIIGIVADVGFSGWRIDTNSAYSAMLNVKDATSEFVSKGADLTKFFKIGDIVFTKILNVTSQKLIDLSMRGPDLRKLEGGTLISIDPNKVPRLIGKNGSMVTLMKEGTGCRIYAGQNGLVWIKGEPEAEVRLIKIIKIVEEEAHTPGLTKKIEEYVKEMSKEAAK